ncbi:alpha-L-rhamnosidase C-terminal domain-containing protein [Sinomonas albida]|uniref:alpha-L-rhamnosidase-related protein n=1 Tax=Sinomonas albida TaxID=369942 RepID=UPI0030186051
MAGAGLRPVRLRVEGAEACLTAGPTPRLAWQAEPAAPLDALGDAPASSAGPAAAHPVAAEPEVRAADGRLLWAPGRIPLPRRATTRVVVPDGAALPPDTACGWRVRLQTDDGAWGPWSDDHAFGTGLFDGLLFSTGRDDRGPGGWTAQWIARPAGGRAPLRITDGELRWHGTPFLPAPVKAGADFVLDAELRPVLGAAGFILWGAGPGTGLLLELERSRVVLRPAPRWEQPCEPEDWATEPLVEAVFAPERAEAGRPPHPGSGPLHRLRAEARGGRLSVAVDGLRLAELAVPAPAGTLIALHAAPRAEGALQSLTISVGAGTGAGTETFRYRSSDGLAGWPATTAFRQPDEWTLLRTEAVLAGPVRRAVVYAAARHQAWVSVGGREVLELSSFGYPGEDYYDAADVTAALRAVWTGLAGQRNTDPRVTLAILSHWYGPGQGRASTVPGVLAELRVEYDDGSRAVFATGPGWRVAEAPYAQAGYRNDEGDPIEHSIGALHAGWDASGFDDSGWEPARVLGANPCPEFPAVHPRRAHTAEVRDEPVRWLEADDGTPVADFGTVRARRPRAGWDALHSWDAVRSEDDPRSWDAPRSSDEQLSGDAPVRLRAGYELKPDGRVDDATLPSQNTDMSFLVGGVAATVGADPVAGGARAATTNFDARVHLGFRYLEFGGAAPARLDAAVVRGAHPAEATFECSDPRLTDVLRLLQDSALHGVQERFVDTPTREKGQFLADAANISYATMAAFGEREFTRQALREFAWSGRRYWDAPHERGRVNAVYPNGDGKRDIPDFSLMLPEWTEAYWNATGDDAFVAELLPTLEATCGYALRSLADSGPCAGLVTNLEGGGGPYLHGIVDWPAPNRFGYDIDTAARTTVNAQAFAALAATARLSARLGRDRHAALLSERAAALADAMHRKLRVDGVFVDGLREDGSPSPHASQHATVFPLAVGATAPDFRAADAHRAALSGLRMGPLTWHRLLGALISEGLVDQALGVVLDNPDRGPLAWLACGATFAWESWELEPGSDHSQSHAWSSAAWPVLVDGILGLRRVSPGLFELRVPECRLDWARAELPIDQGTLRVAWRRTAAGVELECELPPGTEAWAEMPSAPGGANDGGRRLLGAGHHRLGHHGLGTSEKYPEI